MDLVEVHEGRARLRLPPAERPEHGPGAKDAAVFYNPAMATNRDLGSLLVATQARAGWDVLDGLAASGIRGIRYALEAGVPLNVEWNDWNPVSVRLLEDNARLNGIEPRVTQRNLAPLLHEKVWHLVELDPYGSPAPFLDGATRALRMDGLLAITATDTTGLAGVAPKACKRRYDAWPLHGELGHEVAQRILAGAVVRHAAKHDIGYYPVLAHATDHYYRVTLRARRGAQRADAALEHVGMLQACDACGHRGFGDSAACDACGAPARLAGPMWTGPLLDAAVLDAMVARAPEHPLARPETSRALLDALAQEARGPLLFHDLHHVGSRLRLGSPPRAAVFARLAELGYRTAPVHFDIQGVRTDAPAREVARVVREFARPGGA